MVIEETAGGGGYGDPLDRDPLLAARDVAFDYISESVVFATYGVVMKNGTIDEQATATARSQIANDRVHLTLQDLQGVVDSEFDGSRRIAIVSSSTAKHLHATQGTLIELPNPNGPSLRAWLHIDDAVYAGNCAIGPSALAILNLAIGASVEVRLLDTATH